MHAITIDEMHGELHRRGWSLGELAYEQAERFIWQVDARRGEKWIVARESTQTAAWREAWRAAKTHPVAAL
jgi:hypothetical protein